MASIDIDVDDFLYSCSSYDIRELITALVEDGHLPKEVLNKEGEVREETIRRGRGEEEFSQRLESLKTKYYSLSQEEEEFFDKLFKRYL
jgi:hypothetical protein